MSLCDYILTSNKPRNKPKQNKSKNNKPNNVNRESICGKDTTGGCVIGDIVYSNQLPFVYEILPLNNNYHNNLTLFVAIIGSMKEQGFQIQYHDPVELMKAYFGDYKENETKYYDIHTVIKHNVPTHAMGVNDLYNLSTFLNINIFVVEYSENEIELQQYKKRSNSNKSMTLYIYEDQKKKYFALKPLHQNIPAFKKLNKPNKSNKPNRRNNNHVKTIKQKVDVLRMELFMQMRLMYLIKLYPQREMEHVYIMQWFCLQNTKEYN